MIPGTPFLAPDAAARPQAPTVQAFQAPLNALRAGVGQMVNRLSRPEPKQDVEQPSETNEDLSFLDSGLSLAEEQQLLADSAQVDPSTGFKKGDVLSALGLNPGDNEGILRFLGDVDPSFSVSETATDVAWIRVAAHLREIRDTLELLGFSSLNVPGNNSDLPGVDASVDLSGPLGRFQVARYEAGHRASDFSFGENPEDAEHSWGVVDANVFHLLNLVGDEAIARSDAQALVSLQFLSPFDVDRPEAMRDAMLKFITRYNAKTPAEQQLPLNENITLESRTVLRDTIAGLQHALSERGYYSGPINGLANAHFNACMDAFKASLPAEQTLEEALRSEVGVKTVAEVSLM